MGKYPRISCNEFLAPSELIIFISGKNNSDLILQQVGSRLYIVYIHSTYMHFAESEISEMMK